MATAALPKVEPKTWDCPTQPMARVKLGPGREDYERFRYSLTLDDPEKIAAMEALAASSGSLYLPADPAVGEEGIPCEDCPSVWHSRRAFALHYRYAHRDR
jgi:hypothetical protein